MPERHSYNIDRRSVLKATGAAGLTALAGCTGEGGGEQEEGEVIAAVPPTGWWAVLRKLAQDEGYFQQAADEVGADVTFSFENTWDDVPTWIANNADIAQFGALEASRIGPRRDIEITVFGKNTPLNFAPLVQTGGPYDPDNTGGVQQSIDKIVEDGANFAIGSWGGADATSYDVAFGGTTDYRFEEEGGDFSVVTSGYFTIGQQVAQGDVEVGSSGEGMGAAPQMMSGDIKPLFWLKDYIPNEVLGEETEWGFPTMQNLVTRTEFYEENEGAIETYYRAQEMALQELRENPVEVITRSDEYIETMGAGSEEEARFIVNYGINLEGTDTLEPPEHASVYESTSMSDEYVEKQSNFFDRVAELGLTESNWSEYVQHVQFD
ncbi:hypothetical protein [Salinibaculum salinum]|uniref:hypothetical protein n=1 Tax=Salinibaculum salinum TaxID=3131996 RepID=UPI0030EB7E07